MNNNDISTHPAEETLTEESRVDNLLQTESSFLQLNKFYFQIDNDEEEFDVIRSNN